MWQQQDGCWTPSLTWSDERLRSIAGLQDILDAVKFSDTFEWGIYIASDDIEHTGVLIIFDREKRAEAKIVCVDVDGGRKGGKWGAKEDNVYSFLNLAIGVHDFNRLRGLEYYILQELSSTEVGREHIKDMVESMLLCDPGKYNFAANNCRDHVLLILNKLSSYDRFNVGKMKEMKELILALKEKDWKNFTTRIRGFLRRA